MMTNDLASYCYPSDSYPATIISRTEKEIVVQERDTGPNKRVWPEQEFDTFPNPNGRIMTFTLRKNGRWVEKGNDMWSYPYLAIGYARLYQAPEI